MTNMPVFVKIEEYDEAVKMMLTIRRKLENAKSTLAKINELKEEEDLQVQTWQQALGEIEARLGSIDQILKEPESF
jgi:hypothetical protein